MPLTRVLFVSFPLLPPRSVIKLSVLSLGDSRIKKLAVLLMLNLINLEGRKIVIAMIDMLINMVANLYGGHGLLSNTK